MELEVEQGSLEDFTAHCTRTGKSPACCAVLNVAGARVVSTYTMDLG
jgi:hypothetical protein